MSFLQTYLGPSRQRDEVGAQARVVKKHHVAKGEPKGQRVQRLAVARQKGILRALLGNL